jgi:hypothetical protein
MDLEELAARLAEVEADNSRQREMREKQGFMDKYGTKFSGDEGLGVAILGELGRRGIDVSAADEAVQEILDGLRREATLVLDKIKMDQTTVSDLVDKIGTIEEGVQAASGAAPEPETESLPPEGMPPEGAPPPEAAPPPEGLPPEGAPPPPPGVVSDERLKKIGRFRSALSPRKAKPAAAPAPVKTPNKRLSRLAGLFEGGRN